MISWSRTLSVYKDFWYTYYKSIGHRQMFLLPADSADRADVVYTETPKIVKVKDDEHYLSKMLVRLQRKQTVFNCTDTSVSSSI